MVPNTVHWLVTTACNLRCRFCYAPQLHDRTKADAAWVISALADAGVQQITVTGGEPLIHPNLPRLLKHGFDLGLKFKIHSNGILLDRRFLIENMGYIKRMSLAIDGGTEKVADAHRDHPGFYSKFLKNMAIIREIGRPLDVKTVLTALNKEDIGNLEALLEKELSYSEKNMWYISEFSPLHGAARHVTEYELPPGAFDECIAKLRPKAFHLLVGNRSKVEKTPYCYVTGSGMVFTHHPTHSGTLQVGSLSSRPLEELWQDILLVHQLPVTFPSNKSATR